LSTQDFPAAWIPRITVRAPASACGQLTADRGAGQFQPTQKETGMSKFMEFLEQMGQDAQLRYATSSELEQALIRAQIEE
jgi:hypothetical protein